MNEPGRATCSCGAPFRWLPTAGGGRMPVDVDRDPHGVLAAVRLPGGRWGVRVLTAAERDTLPPGAPRFTPHWVTCPHAEQYRRAARTAPPGTPPPRTHGRTGGPQAGPCALCRTTHPRRYGPGGSPVCDDCRAERPIPPVN